MGQHGPNRNFFQNVEEQGDETAQGDARKERIDSSKFMSRNQTGGENLGRGIGVESSQTRQKFRAGVKASLFLTPIPSSSDNLN